MGKIQEIYCSLNSGTLRETLLHAKNYLFGNVAAQALGLISMPIFTRLLTEADYGVVSIFMATIGLVSTIFYLNITDGVSRYYYDKQRTDFGEFLSSILQIIGILSLPAVLIILFYEDQLMDLLSLSSDLSLFLLFGVVFSVLMKLFRQIHVAEKKSRAFVTVNVIQAYSGFGLSWLFIATWGGAGYYLRLLGVVIAQVCSGMWMLFKTIQYVKWAPLNWKHVKYSLQFALPRLPFVLSAVILSQFDRIMIGNLIGAEQSGLYSVGYNVGGLSLLIITAVTPALLPNFYRLMNEDQFAVVDKLNNQILWIINVAGAGLMLGGGLLLTLLADAKFHFGARVIPAVVMGYMFYALAGVYNRYSSYYKLTILQSIGAILAGATNIILNLIWLPKFGIIAAAYTTSISYAIQAIVTWLLIKRFVKGHVTPFRLTLKPILFTLGVFAILEGQVIWDLMVLSP